MVRKSVVCEQKMVMKSVVIWQKMVKKSVDNHIKFV